MCSRSCGDCHLQPAEETTALLALWCVWKSLCDTFPEQGWQLKFLIGIGSLSQLHYNGFIKNALATVIYNISNNFIFRNSNRVLWFPMRIMGLATLSIMSRGNYSVARDSHTTSRHSTLLLILLLSCRQTTTAARVRLTAQKCRQSLDGNKAEEISSTFQSGRS